MSVAIDAAPAAEPRAAERAAPRPLRIGVVGYGYWGPNLVRNIVESPGAALVAVSDLRSERLTAVQARYPAVTVTTDAEDVLRDPAVDAIVVATPVASHFELAMTALRRGKHVLISKPMVATTDHALRLIEQADRNNLVLMVDHTFVYTGAVRKMKELIDSARLGRLFYYDSVRVNLGLFQHDVNVLWDLAVHDLAIMDYVLGATPRAIAATGAAHVDGHPVSMAYLTCFFDDNLLAHHHVNWLAPVKIRRTLVGGDRQMIVYDDLEPSEKIKVYDKGVTVAQGNGHANGDRVYESMVGYRSGDMWAPKIPLTEGLAVEVEHFLDCVQRGARPLSDGLAGLRVVRILEAAVRSLANRGEPVELPTD
jgi:predicted dehydrogenase